MMEEPMNGDTVVDQHVKGILDELVMESAMKAASTEAAASASNNNFSGEDHHQQPKTNLCPTPLSATTMMMSPCLPNGTVSSPSGNVLVSPSSSSNQMPSSSSPQSILPSSTSPVMTSGTPVILPLIHRPNILNSNAISHQIPSTPPSQEAPSKMMTSPTIQQQLVRPLSSMTLTPPSTQSRDSPTHHALHQVSPSSNQSPAQQQQQIVVQPQPSTPNQVRLTNSNSQVVQSPTSSGVKTSNVNTATPMLIRTSSTGSNLGNQTVMAVVPRGMAPIPNNMSNTGMKPTQQTVLLTQADGTKVPVVIQTSSSGQATFVSTSNNLTMTNNVPTSSGGFLVQTNKAGQPQQSPLLLSQQQQSTVNSGQPQQQQQGRQQVIVSNPMQQMVLTRAGGPPINLQQFQTQQQGNQVAGQQQQQMPRGMIQNRPNFILNGPQAGIRFATPNRPGGPTPLVTPGPNGSLTLPPGMRGPILIRTENGLQLVNITGPVGSATASPANQGQLQPGQLRFQTVQGIRPQQGMVNLSSPLRPGMVAVSGQQRPQQQLQQSVQMSPRGIMQPQQQQQLLNPQPQQQMQGMPTTQPLSISTSQANSQASSAAPSQMSPNTAKKKCKNFLSTLIKLANDQPEQVATNVRKLIQGLIDGLIPPENFTDQLQKELKSSPQPCLVPFLKKSLPHLRQSLALGELTIEGVQPPQAVAMTPGGPAVINQQFQQLGGRPGLRFMTPTGMVPHGMLIQRPGMPAPHQGMMTMPVSTSNLRPPTSLPLKAETPAKEEKEEKAKKEKPPKKPKAPPKGKKEPKEPKEKINKADKDKVSNSLREDDDINDVAAMGGVNLQEESQRMAAAANEVGTQIRSCKDDTSFLFTNALNNRINRIASKYSLEESSSIDVVSLISHAAQERLKTLIERLGVIAEHRLENMKMNPKYEVKQDVRAQVKFLEELDKLEKKRHEELERELLIRAAKSRSKLEDPEQVKLKQKAKEMQRAEQEEIRQKEANETALLAIGPRKKQKTDGSFDVTASSGLSPSSSNTPANNNSNSSHNNSHFSNSIFSTPFASGSKLPMRRMKRVNMKDLLFLMEQDRNTSKSSLLYRSYAK